MFIYLIYFLTRIYNISQLPIFNDEAFFLWVGTQLRLNFWQNIFINFTDGKEPLFFWIYSLAPNLMAIRLLSVFLGFLNLIYLRKISANLLLSILYLCSPFLLFYQRLGMQETLLTFLLTASLYYAQKRNFVLLGVFCGLAMLTKTTALLFIIPLFLYRFNIKAIFIVAIMYLPVVLIGQSVNSHNQVYAGLISPSQMFVNYKMAVKWLWEYQGPIGLFGAALPPVILESLVAKIFFPRYFLFIIPVLLIVISKFPKWLVILFLIPNIILSFQIVTDVKTANLPFIEKWQYIQAWPAGYGIEETANFLKSQKIESVMTEDIMITKNGLSYFYPELKIGSGNIFVLKKSKEIANQQGWEKLYNSYDVSVYRSHTGTQ